MSAAGESRPLSFRVDACSEESFCVTAGTLDANVIFLCDHASNALPVEYGTLGLPAAELQRHIAYDAGTATITRVLAESFGAPAICSRFSRLLIDINRGSDDPTLVMRISDGALIAGNARIDAAEIEARRLRFHEPYHECLAGMLDGVLAAGIVPAIVSLHSFTPIMKSIVRPWHVGVLWDSDPRLSVALIARLKREAGLVIGDNQPYDGALAGDTIDRHATRRGLANTLIEVRNDLVQTEAEATRWGHRLAAMLEPELQAAELRHISHAAGSRTRLRMRRH